jgi:hypothetical protein
MTQSSSLGDARSTRAGPSSGGRTTVVAVDVEAPSPSHSPLECWSSVLAAVLLLAAGAVVGVWAAGM